MTARLRELAETLRRGDCNDAECLAIANEITAILDAEVDGVVARSGGVSDADVEDAARYRWLRDHCKREWESDMPHNKGAPSLDIDFSADGHDLDSAIDAARKGERHELP